MKKISYVIANRHLDKEIAQFMSSLKNKAIEDNPDWKKSAIAGFVEGLKISKPELEPKLSSIQKESSADIDQAVKMLNELLRNE